MSDYYVYFNSVRPYAKVHTATCPHCRDGRGPSGEPVGPGDQFIAASSKQEAWQRAVQLVGKPSYCGVCLPNSN